MARGFTLIELMVVVGIIVLLATIAAPSVGPMLSANQEAQVINTLNGLLTKAQTTAQAQGTKVAVRIERAFKMHERGVMEDVARLTTLDAGFAGPVWLDYQRARIVTYAAYHNDRAYRHDTESKLYNLPKGFWLAPGYSFGFENLAESNPDLWHDPKTEQSPAANAALYNRLENFYLVFDGQGELAYATQIEYADQTQTYSVDYITPRVIHPDGSARSLLVYDRKKWQAIPQEDDAARRRFLAREAKPVYINRALGSLVEGIQQ